jgi:hypothetical protein
MPDPALQEAITLAKQGKRNEAQALAAQYLKANPQDVSGWIAMARLVEDPQRALQCWKRASELRPDDVRIKDEIAKIETSQSVDLLSDISPEAAPKPKLRRRSRLGIVLGLLGGTVALFLAVVLLGPKVSAQVYPCGRFGVVDTLEPLNVAHDKFKDQSIIAESTPRMSLSIPLNEMQDTYHETQELEVPECASEVHEALLFYMEREIDSLLSFLAQDSDSTVTAMMLDAIEAEQRYLELSIAMIIDTALPSDLRLTPAP